MKYLIILGFVLVTRVYLEKEKILKILKLHLLQSFSVSKHPYQDQDQDLIGLENVQTS